MDCIDESTMIRIWKETKKPESGKWPTSKYLSKLALRLAMLYTAVLLAMRPSFIVVWLVGSVSEPPRYLGSNSSV